MPHYQYHNGKGSDDVLIIQPALRLILTHYTDNTARGRNSNHAQHRKPTQQRLPGALETLYQTHMVQ